MRNPIYENALSKQGVSFTYLESVQIKDICQSSSIRNQARIELPLDDDLVLQYAESMNRNDPFPPLVAYKPRPIGKLVLIDGNHRLAAKILAGQDTVEVYLIDAIEQLVADRITWTFNNLVNGRRLSKEESIQHAISLIDIYKFSIPQAAKEVGVAESTIKKIRTANKIREIVEKGGRKTKLSTEVLYRLSGLTSSGEDIVSLAVRVAEENGLSVRDIIEFVSNVKSKPTHKEKTDYIEQYETGETARTRRAQTKMGTERLTAEAKTPTMKLISWMNKGTNIFHKFPLPATTRPHIRFEELRGEALNIVNQLVEIFGLGKTLS